MLIKAMGPESLVPKEPSRYKLLLNELGIQSLPEEGDYFLEFYDFLRKRNRGKEEVDYVCGDLDLFEHYQKRLLSEQECSLLYEWLKAIRKPLDSAVKASQFKEYFIPLVSYQAPPFLVETIGVNDIRYLYLAGALVTRAMVRLNSGNNTQAQEDLLAVHRIARLLQLRCTHITTIIISIEIEKMASSGDIAMSFMNDMPPDILMEYMGLLSTLSMLPEFKESNNESVRFMQLDRISDLARQAKSGNYRQSAIPEWNYMLEWINKIADKRSPIMSAKNYQEVVDLNNEYIEYLKRNNFWHERDNMSEILLYLGAFFQPRRTASNFLIRNSSTITLINWPKIFKDAEIERVRFDLAKLTIALSVYKSTKGSYPKELKALTPQFVNRIPKDRFSNKAYCYQTNEDSNKYILYSFGPDKADDNGDRDSDDIAIHSDLYK